MFIKLANQMLIPAGLGVIIFHLRDKKNSRKVSFSSPPVRTQLQSSSSIHESPQHEVTETASIILPKREQHFLFHAAYMSELVILWVHREDNLNKSPPTESTNSQWRSMDVSNSFGHQFYHPQGHNIGKSVNHVVHHDSRLMHTSSLSSLLFDSILSNATAA